jgi:hypothetical protein
MESNSSSTSPTAGTVGATPGQQDADAASTSVRTRIAMPANGAPRPGSADTGAADAERLARRYGREAQLALEGLLYWGLRWPFELMAALVEGGRKWEEQYNRPTPKRRVSMYDEEL